MVKVKALRNGQTRLVGQIRTMAGECIGFTEVLSADAFRIAFGAYADSGDICAMRVWACIDCTNPALGGSVDAVAPKTALL